MNEPAPPGMRWANGEFGPMLVKVKPSRKTTPHSALRHACRSAVATWKREHGCSTVLRRSYVGKVTTSDRREITVGTRGESDDMFIVGKDGVLWGVIAAEYKAGRDQKSEVQRQYEERCQRAGVLYVLCRSPADLIRVLDNVLRPF